MKKIKLGIDISKEKLNLCYLSNLEIVREEEVSNDVKTIKKASRPYLSPRRTSSCARNTRGDTFIR